jgi:hypothetical protein
MEYQGHPGNIMDPQDGLFCNYKLNIIGTNIQIIVQEHYRGTEELRLSLPKRGRCVKVHKFVDEENAETL